VRKSVPPERRTPQRDAAAAELIRGFASLEFSREESEAMQNEQLSKAKEPAAVADTAESSRSNGCC